MILCPCGCGENVKPGKKYAGKGHVWRVNNPNKGKTGREHPCFGRKRPDSERKAISESHKGKGNGMYGKDPWNKGKTSETDNRIASGESHPFYGKHHSEETIAIIKQKAIEEWADEGLRKWRSEKSREQMLSPEHQQRNVEQAIKMWEDGKFTINYGPSKIEDRFAEILNDAGLKYVRQFKVGSKIADFFLPQQNLIIEIDGCYFHGCRDCCPDSPNEDMFLEREQYYSEQGYASIRIWQHEYI